MRIPDGLTLRMTKNVRNKTTTIVAYRKGGSRRQYKAILPMCQDSSCKLRSPHSKGIAFGFYHERDIDVLMKNLIKSYS